MSQPTLLGSWKLVSFELELRNSKERQRPFGANPNGYLILGSDGRMMTLITAKARTPGQTDSEVVALFRTMMSYTGRYRIEGERFITKVDASWNEAWTGSEQARFFKIDGDRLAIISDWAPSATLPDARMVRAILAWERA